MSTMPAKMMLNIVAGRSPSLFYIDWRDTSSGYEIYFCRQNVTTSVDLTQHLTLAFLKLSVAEQLKELVRMSYELLATGALEGVGDLPKDCELRVAELLDEDLRPVCIKNQGTLPWVQQERFRPNVPDDHDGEFTVINPGTRNLLASVDRTKAEEKPLRYIVLAVMEKTSTT